MEAWKFLVVESDRIKKALRPVCWNQPQITDASHVVVILARPGIVNYENDYVKNTFDVKNRQKWALCKGL